MTKPDIPIRHNRLERGFSLIELMIAITIGLFILAGMLALFAASSQSHNELEKASRQIENGRFAIETLREDIELAGYYGDYQPIVATNWTTPDPCDTATISSTQFSAVSVATPSVPTGIYGYNDIASAALSTSCTNTVLPNKKAGTDVLVIRRASTQTGTTGVTNDFYLQVSNCYGTPVELAFVVGQTPVTSLHTVDCTTVAPTRKYIVRIYYIANCSNCSGAGDGIPTLQLVEMNGGSFTRRSIAEGIENMQLEFGTDTISIDGIPDAYVTAETITTPVGWSNVVGIKAFILARNTETTPGYTDSKVYVLNSSDDNSTGIGPFGDHYRRHAYSVSARANNISGRRQQ